MESSGDEDRRPPRRTLNKQEAVRHLLHAAIRLIAEMEDPFAVHLLVQSADKLLIDLARSQSKVLRVDWEDYIKPEYHKPFFAQHREVYNYFKHANEDFADDLPVRDIMMMNVMQLFIGIANYASLFRETTNHMILFYVFALNVSPQLVRPDGDNTIELKQNIRSTEYTTPQEFFRIFRENAQTLPHFYAEQSKDLEDIVDFYRLSFHEIRLGIRKSPRLLRLPE